MTTILHKKFNERNKPQPEFKDGRIKRNKTTQWLGSLMHTELLGNSYISINDAGFIKAYLSDHSREVLHDEHLYYLFNPSKFTANFDKFCKYAETLPLFTELYDIRPTDMGKVMIVMEIPEKWKRLRQLFIDGSYSLFPEEYMRGLINTNPWSIYTKDPEYKRSLEEKIGQNLSPTAELESIPDLNEEVFNYDKNIKV